MRTRKNIIKRKKIQKNTKKYKNQRIHKIKGGTNSTLHPGYEPNNYNFETAKEESRRLAEYLQQKQSQQNLRNKGTNFNYLGTLEESGRVYENNLRKRYKNLRSNKILEL